MSFEGGGDGTQHGDPASAARRLAEAHPIVQNDSSDIGCWAHGIVHLLEGDVGNARYWYRRAGRPFPRERDASAEIDALIAKLKARTAPRQAPARGRRNRERARR